MEESRPGNRLNKKSLSPETSTYNEGEMSRDDEGDTPADFEIELGMWVAQLYGMTSILQHNQ